MEKNDQKINLFEIETLLTEISPWPWNPCCGTEDNPEYLEDANGHIINDCFDSIADCDKFFVHKSPQIIRDLLDRLKKAEAVLKLFTYVRARDTVDLALAAIRGEG